MRKLLISTAALIAAISYPERAFSAQAAGSVQKVGAMAAADKSASKAPGQTPTSKNAPDKTDFSAALRHLNPAYVAGAPVEGHSGYIVPLKPTNDVCAAIENCRGEELSKIIILTGKGDPAAAKALRDEVEKAIRQIETETLELVRKVDAAANGSFEADCAALGVDPNKYVPLKKSANEPRNGRKSFLAIPLIIFPSSQECSLCFPPPIKRTMQKDIKRGTEIIELRELIKRTTNSAKKESPQVQSSLDKIAKLEQQNEELVEQLKIARERNAGQVSAAETKLKQKNDELKAKRAGGSTTKGDKATAVLEAEGKRLATDVAKLNGPCTEIQARITKNSRRITTLTNGKGVSDALARKQKTDREIGAAVIRLHNVYEAT
jgi:hypothetical protein